MSRLKSLVKNSFVLTLGTILPKVMSFLSLPILTAYLTKVEYGTYDLVLTGVSLVIPIASLQIEQAVFRFLIDSDKDQQRIVISTSLLFVILSSATLFILGSIFLTNLNNDNKYLICTFAALTLLHQYFLQLMRGLKLLHQYSFITILNSMLGLFLIVALVRFLELGLSGLLISMNVAILISITAVLYISNLYRKISLFSISMSTLKEMLKYSSPMLPNSISWWVVGLSNRWVISFFLGIESAATFAVANKIPSLFNLTYNAFNLSWQESASLSINDRDSDYYYSKVFRHLTNFLFGILYFLISISPILFHVFIDSAYEQAYYHMLLLFIGALFHSFSSFYGGLYIALKKTTAIGLSSMIGAIISLIVNISLISKIGLLASGISIILSYLSITIYRAFGIRRHIQIVYSPRKLTLYLILLVVVCTVSYVNHIYLNLINIFLSLLMFFLLNRELIFNLKKMLINKLEMAKKEK